jgi:hypothetical protein
MKIARFATAAAFVVLATTAAHPRAAAGPVAETRQEVGQMAPDGLPEVIPPPGSNPPSVAEWDSVTREVTVRNSSRYHCETKMLREWLRVTCYPYDAWTLKNVVTRTPHGHQAFTGMFGPKASVVVQVVRGKTYVARYVWNDDSFRDLTVSWPGGNPRPSIGFN